MANHEPLRNFIGAAPGLAEHIPEACVDCLAGHRIDRNHDCFAMNCKDLGPEVVSLRDQLARLSMQLGEYQDIVQQQAAIMVREKSHDWLGAVIADPQTRDYVRDAALTLRDWMVEPDEEDGL